MHVPQSVKKMKTAVFPYLIFWLIMVTGALLLAACQTAPEAPVPTSPPPPTAVPAPTPNPAALPDDEAELLIYQLWQGSTAEAHAALQTVIDAGDARFVAALIELFRGRQLGLVAHDLSFATYSAAIQELAPDAPGADWFELVEWYGRADRQPPPGFTSWKGQMLAQIDPGFADFLRDDHPARIRPEEIQWGGVTIDAIPALDDPAMLRGWDVDYLNSQDAVFGIVVNHEARAYPLRIMDWHEMANDLIGGQPVTLSYCTLCGAAIAFDGRASDGNTYTFGSSGFLFRSNKLMYDRQTRTLWNQLTGEPVLGPLADSDVRLNVLPVVLTTWEAWLETHPDTLVLSRRTGFDRDYSAGAAYGDYFAFEDTMFPVAQRSGLLAPKDQVFAIRIDETPKAYPIDVLVAERVVNDILGETAVVILAPRDVVEIEGQSLRSGSVRYQAGGEVRAYDRGNEIFAPGPSPNVVLDSAKREWHVTEEALRGPDGAAAPRLGGHLAYWFGWYAFFPNTQVYGVE